jgi:hypothetical protein
MGVRLIDPKTLQWNYKSASPKVDILGAAPGHSLSSLDAIFFSICHLVSSPQQNSRNPRFLIVLGVAGNGRLVIVRFCQSIGSAIPYDGEEVFSIALLEPNRDLRAGHGKVNRYAQNDF